MLHGPHFESYCLNRQTTSISIYYLKIEAKHQSQGSKAASRSDLLSVHTFVWVQALLFFHFL